MADREADPGPRYTQRLRRTAGSPAGSDRGASPAVAPPAVTEYDDDAAEPEPVLPAEPRMAAGREQPRRTRELLHSPVAVLALVMIAIGILAGGFSAYYEYTRPPTYRSTAVLLIDQPQQVAASKDDGVVNKLARLRVKYVGLIGTQVFAQPLAEQVAMPIGVVHGALRAVADPTSLLLDISATLPSRQQAHTLADAAGQQLVSFTAAEQQRDGIAKSQQIAFSVVTPATAGVRVTPDRRRAVLVGVLVFVALTIAGGVGADLLRRRRLRRIRAHG